MKLTEQITKSGDVEIVSEYGSYVRFDAGEDWVDLDGSFTIQELEKIVHEIKIRVPTNKNGK